MILKFYLRLLAIIYFVGFVLHVADILNVRLNFSEMDNLWQSWIIYLCVFDFLASIGLWKQKSWGVKLFFLIAISQLIAYIGFAYKFGEQNFLIVFHLVTLALYMLIWLFNRKGTSVTIG